MSEKKKSPSPRVTKAKLQRRIIELEAKLVGTESALKLAQRDFEIMQKTANDYGDRADQYLGQVEDLRKENTDLRKAAEEREASTLSDVEIAALTAEVQAQLAQVPVTDARRRLQAALQSRRVLPSQTNPIAWEKKTGSGMEGWEVALSAAGTDDHTVRVYEQWGFKPPIYQRIFDGQLMRKRGDGGWYAVDPAGDRIGETFSFPWQVKVWPYAKKP